MLASTFVAQLTYYWNKEHSGNIDNSRNNAKGATPCPTLYIVVYSPCRYTSCGWAANTPAPNYIKSIGQTGGWLKQGR